MRFTDRSAASDGSADSNPLLSPVRSSPTSPWPDELFAVPGDLSSPVLDRRTGGSLALDHRRWHGEPDDADLALVARASGPVLDIGCGPGRLTRAVVRAGVTALGIDTSAAAVATACGRGAPAAQVSVFGPVPGAGHWGTALLADGNIGIGGDPGVLLRRAGRLVAPGGRLLVEVEPPGTPSEDIAVRVRRDGRRGPWFPWSRVAATDLPALARAAGMHTPDIWSESGRWFALVMTSVVRTVASS